MNEIMKSKKFKIAAIAIGSLLVALIIFSAGVSVGIHKARFSYNWGNNYERNFMGPRFEKDSPRGPMGIMREKMINFEGRDFRNAHGLAGTIISVSDNNIVIKDRDNKENTVAVSEKTIIKSRRDDIKIGDLKNDNQIVVMGKPGENGVINADLIRVFDDVSEQSNNGIN